MKIRKKVTPASYLILEKEGQVLLMRRCNTGYQDGKYGLPSGHLEEGEEPVDCVIREISEEIAVGIKRQDLIFVCVVYNTLGNQGDYVDFFFKVKSWVGEPKNLEPEKCDDLKWFDLNHLPLNLVPEVDSALKNYLKESYYSCI